jgi:CheY-like chemotaxis protein
MSSDQHQKTNILVVDDDPQVLGIVRKILEAEGYAVRAASSGDVAREKIGSLSPDLIITDIFMPDGDGLEILNMLRLQESRIPVIVMSGSRPAGEADFLKFADRLGATQSLPKPFRSEQLLRAVRGALGRG